MNVISTLAKARFVATDAQVQALANEVVQGQTADGTYLKVLVVAIQADLSTRKRKPTPKQQEAAINAVHERFYPHVLKGVGDDSVEQPERNRRAIFARTAASALRTFVRDGGDLRAVDVAEVSKAKLRPAHEVPTGTRAERAMQRYGDGLLRAAVRLGKAEPDEARRRIKALLDALEAVRNSIVTKAAAARAQRASAQAEHRAH